MEFPSPPLATLPGQLQSSCCAQPSIAPLHPTFKRLLSGFLSVDYFKRVFNTTAETLNRPAGCRPPRGLCRALSAAFSDGGGRKNQN